MLLFFIGLSVGLYVEWRFELVDLVIEQIKKHIK